MSWPVAHTNERKPGQGGEWLREFAEPMFVSGQRLMCDDVEHAPRR